MRNNYAQFIVIKKIKYVSLTTTGKHFIFIILHFNYIFLDIFNFKKQNL